MYKRQVTNSILTNYTALGVRRVDFNYTVSYGTDLNLVRTILLEVAKEQEQVLSSPEPVVVVLRQAANGIEISFRVLDVYKRQAFGRYEQEVPQPMHQLR